MRTWFIICAGPVAAGVNNWLPITDEDRRTSTPVVDKQAGMEGLFWNVYITDSVNADGVTRTLSNYSRLKVFTSAGKDSVSSIDIPYDENTSITGIAARTTRPDGTQIELRKDGIQDVEIVRIGRVKRHVKRLNILGVEPGAIIEYRWNEIRSHQRSLYMRMNFQREYPIRRVTYHVKPLPNDFVGFVVSVRPFNCLPSKLVLDRDGYNTTSLENVAAFSEEPLMPGEPNVRAWALLFYHDGKKRDPEKYWEDIGKETYRELRQSLKITDEVKQATAKALEGASANDKVLAILRYIRRNVRSISDPRVTDAQRIALIRQLPKDRMRTCTEILRSGIALPNELNLLFAAMTTHAGFDSRPALAADRQDMLFHPDLVERLFLNNVDMAIKEGDDWRLYDVSATDLPAGMLTWREEGLPVLVSDSKKPTFTLSKLSVPAQSVAKRTARLRLDEDGSIEGELIEELTGHLAAERRRELTRESDARRKEILRSQLNAIFPNAEITAISMQGVEDSEVPLSLQTKIRISGYAQRTGKRIFLQPLFFQRGDPPLFDSAERRHDVLFRYAWTEEDNISIEFPSGFEPEVVDKPVLLPFGRPGQYSVSEVRPAANRLLWRRHLVFGDHGGIQFEKSLYPKLKYVFDEIHKTDNRMFVLRQAVPPAGAP